MKKMLAMSALAVSVFALPYVSNSTEEKEIYVTVDADAVNFTQKTFGPRVELVEQKDGIAVLKIDESAVQWLSGLMHRNFNRCGGFMAHDTLDEAIQVLDQTENRKEAAFAPFADYSINQSSIVTPMLAQVKADEIFAMIQKLSAFNNRYYKSPTGVESAKFIYEKWKSLTSMRNDAKIEYFNHSSWNQPSVILTIQGATPETVVLGGHQDSISGYFGGSSARAPGADDNASGIATITEVIRVLMQNDYRPTKTIKFMAYAAEEVGLLGSKEIATDYKKRSEQVIGVMQLDMTNFKGNDEFDIVMMTDYTNNEQNKFVGKLADTYLGTLKWGYDRCGYGCSDHASWHNQGYPASIPFEATMSDMNHNIHTNRDTLDVSNNTASHAAKFAKLALSFVIELDR